jgi:hypothetical protein
MRLLAVVPLAGVLATLLSVDTFVHAASMPIEIVVRVYNRFGVSDDDLHLAAQTASAIFREAGITIRWKLCGNSDRGSSASDECGDTLSAGEVSIRMLATSGPPVDRPALGYSYIDTAARVGVLATVLPDRVFAVATRVGSDRRILLGRAMAHEVGHLLLGTTAHSNNGLMRAEWSDKSLKNDLREDWLYSQDDIAQMARVLRERANEPIEFAAASPSRAEGAP